MLHLFEMRYCRYVSICSLSHTTHQKVSYHIQTKRIVDIGSKEHVECYSPLLTIFLSPLK